MKAILLRETGGPEKARVEEVPDPQPDAGEVVVRLKAAALNHRDLWICLGRYAGIKLPIIPGSDGAGVVASVGPEVDASLVGKEVVINPSLDWGDDPVIQGPKWRILGLPDDGTFAEFVRVPAKNIHPTPRHFSTGEAAAFPLGALTAYRAVVTRGQVRSGETVLVTGIGGGVATFVLQIANAVGARVLVSSSSDAKINRARELGALGGVTYSNPDWVKEMVAMCDGRGPDVIVDGAGGSAFDQALEVVRPGGRVVIYGATLGPAREVMVRRIFWKHLTIIGSTMGTPQDFEDVLALYSKKGMRPVIDSTFPLDEASSALRRMETAGQFGKIVLTVGS
jgi:zinc-binding alcohol dehydrogenase/oxidoreductase